MKNVQKEIKLKSMTDDQKLKQLKNDPKNVKEY